MSSEDLTGATVAGYQLLERVGEGGTATVYRATHANRGVCAVKVLREKLRGDRTAVQRFLREASFGSRVQHPTVVQTFDFGEADGLHFLALEWAEGGMVDVVRRLAAGQAIYAPPSLEYFTSKADEPSLVPCCKYA